MTVSKTKAVRAGLLVAAAGLCAVAARVISDKKFTADLTVEQIENMISALDPATRAAVVARLTVDASHHVKDRLNR